MAATLHAFAECLEPARALATRLGVELCPVQRHRFPDGESLVRIEPRGGTAILYRSLDRPNEKLLELLFAASALRDGGATRIVIVAPYLGYMRQDTAFEPGQAVSQKVVANLLSQHCDALLTVDPHLHRVHSMAQVMPQIDARSISAAPVLGAFIDEGSHALLAGPDAESRQWVEAMAGPRDLDLIVGEKTRLGDRQVELTFPEIERVSGRPVILVDDVISSGHTLEVAARQLLQGGASSVEALATHCLASEADLARLKAAGISRVRSSDSVAGPTAVVPLADLLAEAIEQAGWLPH